jgi:acetyl-CoA C-acetyltransferase
MRRAAIVSPVRTAIGSFGGTLSPVSVAELGATFARAVVARTGLDPSPIEDVVFAQSYSNGETPCTGRWVALQAGFPIEVAGAQVDRRYHWTHSC